MSVSAKTNTTYKIIALIISTCLLFVLYVFFQSSSALAAPADIERYKTLQFAFIANKACNLSGNNDGLYKNIQYKVPVLGSDGKYAAQDIVGSFGSYKQTVVGYEEKEVPPDQRSVALRINDPNSISNCQAVLNEMSQLAGAVASYNNNNLDKPNEIVPISLPGAGGSIDPGANPPQGSGTAAKKEQTCADILGGIGWWVCSPLEAATSFADGLWGILEGFLDTDPIDNTGPIYATWESIRNIANALLVVIFLAVIFAQISNIGISNYGIKKILPRLILMAVMINLSFFIVQVSVDFANLVGAAADDFLTSMIPADKALVSSEGGVSWGKFLIGALAGGTLAIGAGATLVATTSAPAIIIFMAILIIPAIIGFVAAIIALFIRNALVPVIAILAPLAFVAYILPNTQNLFNKWKKIFFSLLFLYPMASIYFGALKFGVWLIVSNESSGGLAQLIALATLYAGTVVIALMAIKSNAIMNKMTGTISGAANKLFSPIGKVGKGIAGGMAQSRLARFKSQEKLTGLNKFNPIARGAHSGYRKMDEAKRKRSLNASIYEAKATEDFNEKLRSNPDGMIDENLKDTNAYQGVIAKLNEQDIDNAGKRLEGRDFGSIKSQALNNSVSKADRMAAIRYVLATGSITDYLDLAKNSGNYSSEGNKQERSEIQAAFYKKGIQGVLGSNIGAKILDGNINSDEDINAAVAQTMRDKNINSEALALDAGLTERVANVASGQASFNPGQEPPRDLVTNEGRQFNEGVAEIAKRAKDVKESEHLRTKLKGNAPESIDRIISIKPNGSVAGQVTSPNASPTNNQTTPPPSNPTPPSPPSTPPRKTP